MLDELHQRGNGVPEPLSEPHVVILVPSPDGPLPQGDSESDLVAGRPGRSHSRYPGEEVPAASRDVLRRLFDETPHHLPDPQNPNAAVARLCSYWLEWDPATGSDSTYPTGSTRVPKRILHRDG
jgi:hypothetical protein